MLSEKAAASKTYSEHLPELVQKCGRRNNLSLLLCLKLWIKLKGISILLY